MTVAVFTPCLNRDGRVKKRYVSEQAAHRDLATSQRWRRRAEWPVCYRCPACHGYHLAHPS